MIWHFDIFDKEARSQKIKVSNFSPKSRGVRFFWRLKLDASISADRITRIVEIPFIFKNALAQYNINDEKISRNEKNVDVERNLGLSVSRSRHKKTFTFDRHQHVYRFS